MKVKSFAAAKERRTMNNFGQGMLSALAEAKARDAVLAEMDPMDRVPAAELWAAIHADADQASAQADAMLWDSENCLHGFFGQRLLDCQKMSELAGFRISDADDLAQAYLSIPNGMRSNLRHGHDHPGVIWL